MITLRVESGFIRIQTWEELAELPGFEVDVNPNAVQLHDVIGTYAFPEFVPCGLSTCHQPHKKGYVAITKDGRKTNIGKDCGTTHFGVNFRDLAVTLDRQVREQDQREIVTSGKNKALRWLAELEDLKGKGEGHGASWVQKQMASMRSPGSGLPETVWAKLRDMIKRRSAAIVAERLATKDEKAAMREVGQLPPLRDGQEDDNAPVYVSESVGMLAGLPVLYPENDLRALLITDLQNGLQALSDADETQMAGQKLANLAKWVNEIDGKLKQARELIEAGRELFRQENLKQLAALTRESGERSRVLAFAKRYD